MSIIKINPEDKERYTILANPRRTFSSASISVRDAITLGVTGTLPLFPEASPSIKDPADRGGKMGHPNEPDAFNDGILAWTGYGIGSAFNNQVPWDLNKYMADVNTVPSSSMFGKRQSVIRFEPGDRLDADFLRKSTVKNMLFPYYRNRYPTLQYSYTNYHCLNFVTCSLLPSSTALIYPAGTGTVALEDTNVYAPETAFTFDFHINPRYTEESVGAGFGAGTILHMSSCYAISLVTGSSVGVDGKKDGYRLLLQLSQSAEIPPSQLTLDGDTVSAPGATADSNFIYMTPDNSLSKNEWHHVAIRWGGPTVANGTGSFVIDNHEVTTFEIPSASVMAPIQTAPEQHDADALFVGNFYEGSNQGENPIAGFFNPSAAARFGIANFLPGSSLHDPTDYVLRHPLNAEIHDLKIFNVYRSSDQIFTSSQFGMNYDPYFRRSGVSDANLLAGTSAQEGLIFFVPPFFTKVSPTREINQSPFFQTTGASDDPFNVAMSFQVGGHELNLPNFTREFVRGFYPRPFGLEATRIEETTPIARSANYFLYESGSHRKRNITVLPCDNGKFTPSFTTLLTQSLNVAADRDNDLEKFRDDFGQLDLSVITLDNLVSTANLLKPSDMEAIGDDYGTKKLSTGSILAVLEGASPEDPAVAPGSVLTILQRTKDPSSNAVVFFDISNMFYGDKIKPTSVVLKDLAVTGSAGRVQITLQDDGNGNLYRANSSTPHAKWASVGNVIYEEGIIIIKSPNLPLFGSDAWELTFEGQRNIHVLEFNIVADKGLINSSTNPTYRDLIPSDAASETASKFVYLTGLQLHDENLNVVARANLAQPIVKRDDDRYTIKLRMDF